MSRIGCEAKPVNAVDRAHLSALRELIIHRPGGWADQEALRVAQQLCAAARKEGASRVKVGVIEKMVTDLYSESGHAKWAVTTTTGRDFLRLAILRELGEETGSPPTRG
jgi:hypothetical protein